MPGDAQGWWHVPKPAGIGFVPPHHHLPRGLSPSLSPPPPPPPRFGMGPGPVPPSHQCWGIH